MAPPAYICTSLKAIFFACFFFLHSFTLNRHAELSAEWWKKWKKHKSAHKLKRQQKNKQTSYAHFVNDYYYFNKTSGE